MDIDGYWIGIEGGRDILWSSRIFPIQWYFKRELHTFSKAPPATFTISVKFPWFNDAPIPDRGDIHSFSFTWNSFIDLLWNHFFFVMSLHVKKNAVAADPKKGSWMLDVFTFQFLRNAKARKPEQTKTQGLIPIGFELSCIYSMMFMNFIHQLLHPIRYYNDTTAICKLTVAQLPSIQKQVITGHHRLSTFDSYYPP